MFFLLFPVGIVNFFVMGEKLPESPLIFGDITS
jgi:hypothetical protein